MLDDYDITKPLSIFAEVLFDPGACVLREGKKAKTANYEEMCN
jgi:hypothetical protein